MSESTRLKSTVYVGGLDLAVTAQTLAEAFVPFGEVVDITLPKADAPNSGDAHRGFGYVEFDLPQDAKEAIDNMDQAELFGRVIKVSAAKAPKSADAIMKKPIASMMRKAKNTVLTGGRSDSGTLLSPGNNPFMRWVRTSDAAFGIDNSKRFTPATSSGQAKM